MFKRAYIEITNVCNMNCSFCIGTRRDKRFMSVEDFKTIAEKVRRHTEYIYLHVLGEPLLHPRLNELLLIAEELGFKVNITTNGTMLVEKRDILRNTPCLRKVSVSLHSFEGNGYEDISAYLAPICDFAGRAECITELRLWNGGGENSRNVEIIDFLSKNLGVDIERLPVKNGMRRLRDRLYLADADRFDWPSLDAPMRDTHHCYGLKTQFGVLCDGTVIPCCLDSEGTVALGNALNGDLDEILTSPRAQGIIDGFNRGVPYEELCKRCGYAERFTKKETKL